jgi:hypothetical protein
MKIIFIISDDDKLDQHFTHFVQKEVSEYLKSISYHVNTMHELCDGCATGRVYKSVLHEWKLRVFENNLTVIRLVPCICNFQKSRVL